MVDKKKTPSDQEIKDLLKKAKKGSESKVDKPEERIVDKSIKKVGESKPTNVGNAELVDTIKVMQKQLNTLDTKVNSLAPDHNSLKNKAAGKDSSPISKETDQEGKELSPEEKLAQAQAEKEAKVGEGQKQLTPEEYQKLPDKEKVELLERQLQQDQVSPEQVATQFQGKVAQVQQQVQQQGGKVTGQQIIFLISEGIKATSTIVPALMRGKGGDSGGLTSMIENFKTFGEVSKVFSQIQTNIAKGYSDSLKVMSLPAKQEVAKRMLGGNLKLPVPGAPTSEEHIR